MEMDKELYHMIKNIQKVTGFLGPTGNLRAPSIITGGILIVGFNEETYNSVLNS